MMDLKKELQSFLTGEVSATAADLEQASRDASLFAVQPQAVAYPKDSHDIGQLVNFVNQHADQKLSLTARSGGTDMTGGPLNESIIVDMTKHFNHVTHLGDHEATTQPGVFYRDFETATKQKNLLLPSYPASKDICTVGGMVANNSGGEKTLTYGQTKQYVKQLKVVLHDGHEYTFASLTPDQLKAKMKLANREGDIYRQLYQLLEENYTLIQNAKPKVSKNSTGYHLWDVWNKKTFDLTQLFTGSQGTLGIMTEITFRLVTPKPYTQLLVIFLRDLKNLAQLVQAILPYQPESFESYDDHTLKFALRFLPDIMKRLGLKNIFTMAWQFMPELRLILTQGIPKLVLLAEFTGYDPIEVKKRAKVVGDLVQSFGLTTRLVKNKQEAAKYWIIRRESFNLLRHHVHGKRTAPFIDDIIVRPEDLPEFLPKLEEIISHYTLLYTIAGHIGDANFHIIPLMDLSQPENRQIIPELAEKVYELVWQFGGSISGEHNDGLIRSPYLPRMYGPEVYKLFEQTKKIFDPNNIFNPRKKIGATLDYALQHMVDH